MRRECIDAVQSAAGRTLTQAEIKGIEARVRLQMKRIAVRDRSAWLRMAPAERLRTAAAEVAQILVAEADKKRARIALTILAHDRIQNVVAGAKARGIDGIDAVSRQIAFSADAKLNVTSMESRARAIKATALAEMRDAMKAIDGGFMGLFENVADSVALIKEFMGERTPNTRARQGAEAARKVFADLRERFNAAGGTIGHLEDYDFPHHHSQIRVALAGANRWVTDILPLLDRRRYVHEDGTLMNDEDMAEFLNAAFDSIATGGINKVEPGKAFGRSRMIAGRHSESRQLHFKDAESFITYQAVYGDKHLFSVIAGHISNMARDIAAVETFGPNPDLQVQFFLDQEAKAAARAAPIKSAIIRFRADQVGRLFDFAVGRSSGIGNVHVARVAEDMRNLLIASRLGSAVISALADEGTLQMTARVLHLDPMELARNEFAQLNPINVKDRELAERAGIGLEIMVGEMTRWGQEHLDHGWSERVASTVMRASGMNALTAARQKGFSTTMLGAMGRLVQDNATFAKLSGTDHRILKNKGITEADWAVFRLAVPERWRDGGPPMLTAAAIKAIPDAALIHLGNPERLRREAATKLMAAVLDEQNMAVVEPGLRERFITTGSAVGAIRGTVQGELLRSFFLFKSFPLSLLMRHWSRAASIQRHGIVGKAGYAAGLFVTLSVLGGLVQWAKDVRDGREPTDYLDEEHGAQYVGRAILNGGALGFYGDFLAGLSNSGDQSLFAGLQGPALGLVEDALHLTVGNAFQAAAGEDTHIGAETIRFAKGLTPGANLWYTKLAFDRLIFDQLQEMASPGYTERQIDRSEKKYGSSWWWRPGETTPEAVQ